MQNPDIWITLKVHSFLIGLISFIFYLIFAFIFKLIVTPEELQSIQNNEQKELRYIVVFSFLNAVLFKVIFLATGTTFIALLVKDLL